MIECRSCCTPTNTSNGYADRSKIAFQKRCFPDDLIELQPTSELWVKKKAPASSEATSLL